MEACKVAPRTTLLLEQEQEERDQEEEEVEQEQEEQEQLLKIFSSAPVVKPVVKPNTWKPIVNHCKGQQIYSINSLLREVHFPYVDQRM